MKPWTPLLMILLFAGVAVSDPPNEITETRVIGLEVPVLIKNVFGETLTLSPPQARPHGALFLLAKDGKTIGAIQLGVFADKKTAMGCLTEDLDQTAAGPERVDESIGDKAAIWKDRTAFVRKNVIVSLSLMGQPEEELRRASLAIATALNEEKAGVRLGKAVPMPRITKVELADKLTPGTTASLKVHIVPPEKELVAGTLSFDYKFGVAASSLPLVGATRDVVTQDGQTMVVYTARYEVPKASGKTVQCWACYATADCRTTSEKVVLAGEMGK